MEKTDESKTTGSKSSSEGASKTSSSVVHVPENCPTLAEAIKRVEQNPQLTTVQLGKGDFTDFGTGTMSIELTCPIEIRGAGMGATVLHNVAFSLRKPKEEGALIDDAIIVIADITFDGTTVKDMNGHGGGINTKSGSIPLRVERCAFLNTNVGVCASGVPASVVSCVVRGCKQDGIKAYKTTVTLSGTGTEISNCFNGPADQPREDQYALGSRTETSCIKIVAPLGTDIASGNYAGRNLGGYGRIEIVDEQGNMIQLVSESSPAPVPKPIISDINERTQWDKH